MFEGYVFGTQSKTAADVEEARIAPTETADDEPEQSGDACHRLSPTRAAVETLTRTLSRQNLLQLAVSESGSGSGSGAGSASEAEAGAGAGAEADAQKQPDDRARLEEQLDEAARFRSTLPIPRPQPLPPFVPSFSQSLTTRDGREQPGGRSTMLGSHRLGSLHVSSYPHLGLSLADRGHVPADPKRSRRQQSSQFHNDPSNKVKIRSLVEDMISTETQCVVHPAHAPAIRRVPLAVPSRPAPNLSPSPAVIEPDPDLMMVDADDENDSGSDAAERAFMASIRSNLRRASAPGRVLKLSRLPPSTSAADASGRMSNMVLNRPRMRRRPPKPNRQGSAVSLTSSSTSSPLVGPKLLTSVSTPMPAPVPLPPGDKDM